MKRVVNIRYRIEWWLTGGIQWIVRRWPRVLVPMMGDFCGVLFLVFRIRYDVAYDNMSRSLPELDVRNMLLKNYRHMGRTFVATLVLRTYDRRQDIRLNAPDGFFGEIAFGSILLTGHLGNWEWLGKTLVDGGAKLAVVVRRQTNPWVDKLIHSEREACGMRVVYDDDVWMIVKYLRQGYSIGILADQDFGHNTVPIRFFDRICYAPKGLDFFARFDVPIYCCAAVFVESQGWDVVVEKMETPRDHIAQAYATWLEGMIRRYPEQWLWQHRRWKTPSSQKSCNSASAYVTLSQSENSVLEL